MYFSTGGGIIGGGEHQRVRDANRKLLLAVEKLLAGFVANNEPTKVLPKAISFVVLTFGGLRVARDTEERLKTKKSALWPIFYLGHGVVTSLRTATEARGAR